MTCNCMGPQNGQPLCPCAMSAAGGWISTFDGRPWNPKWSAAEPQVPTPGDTPRTDGMIQPVPGKDCVTGDPIEVVHADDVRQLERDLCDALMEKHYWRWLARKCRCPHGFRNNGENCGPCSA